MPDYQQGKIYKIVCNVTGKVYYGSTIEPTLARRLSKHKTHFNQYKQEICNYITSFEILTNDNYSIVLVELYPCNSRDELLMRERYWIENNECINIKCPKLTQHEIKHYYQQYHQEHKNIKKEYDIIYKQTHKEKIKQIITCECGRNVRSSHILRHKKTIIHNELMQSKIIEN